ncbi:hypothetical protein ACWJJH_15200 [Endozoicomonadaceae bacterium StTr2]
MRVVRVTELRRALDVMNEYQVSEKNLPDARVKLLSFIEELYRVNEGKYVCMSYVGFSDKPRILKRIELEIPILPYGESTAEESDFLTIWSNSKGVDNKSKTRRHTSVGELDFSGVDGVQTHSGSGQTEYT